MVLRIALGADHGGLALKSELLLRLKDKYDILDLGAFTFDAEDDYPDFAYQVAQVVATGRVDRGLIICGSGVGACVTANKVPGIRAGLCHDTYSAHQGVEHDDMNVLCLGARVIGIELAYELAMAFLNAHFDGAERHVRRLRKIESVEHRQYGNPDEGIK